MNKNRIIKVILILFAIYGGSSFINNYNNIQDGYLMQKVLLLTFLITLINFVYPTL